MLNHRPHETTPVHRPAAVVAPEHERDCAAVPALPVIALARCAAWPGDADRSPRLWDQQFQAVCDSLVNWADQGAAPEVTAGVLACVAVLRQLDATLADERARQQQQDSELSDARTSLAQSRLEIIGSRSDERRARRQALHDELTTLPNRRFFDEWLEHMLVRSAPLSQPLAVLYFDLDGFKAINDAYGHAVGDELLRVVAARLARAVRA